MYAKFFYKTFINLALLALSAIFTLGLFSCSSSDSMLRLYNDARLSNYYKSLNIHLQGDTLTINRITHPYLRSFSRHFGEMSGANNP